MTLPSSMQAPDNPEINVETRPNGARRNEPGLSSIRQLALKAGFVEAGWVGLPHQQKTRDARRFTEFVQTGRAATMEYLGRHDENGQLIRSDVQIPFPWARSVVVCMAGYHADAPLSTKPAKEGTGWIARYAWSGRKSADGAMLPSDYHKILLKRLRQLEAAMQQNFGQFQSRAYVDTGPVVERSIATAAGVGWTGKNTCLIHPRLGSWNFLAVLVTSLEVPQESAPLEVPDRCGSCRRCLDACPTGALTAPYQMDANRCISYLTIEHRGTIEPDLLPGIGRNIFGCDICQDVCPWNRKAPLQPPQETELVPRMELVNPPLEWLASLNVDQFERWFNGSPLQRTGFLGLRRNLAIAMGNSGLSRFVPWLQEWAKGENQAVAPNQLDQRSLARQNTMEQAVAEAAQWALRQITNGRRSE